ncbi:hypothetical protein JCM8097_006269 [Rhodosporidiobolus ruineniae]
MGHLSPLDAASGSSSSTSHQGLAFSLSKLLAQKMAREGSSSFPGLGWSAGTGGTGKKGKKKAHEEEERPAFLVSKCPSGTMAQLDTEDGCFCGQLDSAGTTCHGYDENDRRAVCVEDLRSDAQRFAALEPHSSAAAVGGGKKKGRSGRRRATCGLEFLAGFDDSDSLACPIGYARVGPNDKDAPFICQDTASPFSCGTTQRDCYSQPGVLRAACSEGKCEIMMCQEGWRFAVVDSEDGSGEAVTSCVPSKPLFFAPPP